MHPPASTPPMRQATAAPALCFAVAALLALAMAPGGARAETQAGSFEAERDIVEALHGALLTSMQSGASTRFEERREALRGVLEKSFDFPFMAEKSAGRYWRDLGADDRDALTAAVRDLAATNYAARFNAWDGERFETTGAEVAAHSTVLVRTRIVQGDATAARLDYRLREDPTGHARIVDVFLNGTVSELAMRRAEYSSVIKREGFDALLAALRERVASLPVSAR